MEYRSLGTSGLKVPVLCLGAMTFGEADDDDNLKAADVKLSAQDVQKLDDASAYELGYPYKFIANIQKRW